MRRHHLLNWAVVICSLLLPLTAVAGMIPSSSSPCGMSTCHCDCCQQQGNRQCRASHASCACPGLPALTATFSGSAIKTMFPYKTVMVKPAARLFIFSIYHPPENILLFSL